MNRPRRDGESAARRPALCPCAPRVQGAAGLRTNRPGFGAFTSPTRAEFLGTLPAGRRLVATGPSAASGTGSERARRGEAAGLGFEPRLLGPEPSVLPLDDPATCRCGRKIVAEPRAGQNDAQ